MRYLFVAIALLVSACRSSNEAERQRFVLQLLSSIRDETTFYQRYVHEPQRIIALKKRHPGAFKGELRIINREEYPDGTFDYGTTCGTDLACIVYITESGGRVVSADLAIVPRAK